MRRRWFTVSLRTLIILVTAFSALCAWQFYYRRQALREIEEIRKTLAGTDAGINFDFYLFGYEIKQTDPNQMPLLWHVGIPRLQTIFVRTDDHKPLLPKVAKLARRFPEVRIEGGGGCTDALLRSCVSDNTEVLTVHPSDLSADCFTFVHDCPKLKEVEATFLMLSGKSMEALLTHPTIERLEVTAHAEELSLLGRLEPLSPIQRLEIKLDFPIDYRPANPLLDEPRGSFRIPTPGESLARFRAMMDPTPSGDFAWLKQCPALQEISVHADQHALLSAVGRQIGGVHRLNLGSLGEHKFELLGSWTRLRHLSIEAAEMNDSMLAAVVQHCANLETLEIDEHSFSKVALSPTGLRALHDLNGLKRLRLGGCHLNVAHMNILSEMPQLEALSFEDRGIDDKTIEPLRKLPNLKQISLERTKASKQTFASIRGDWDDNRPWRN